MPPTLSALSPLVAWLQQEGRVSASLRKSCPEPGSPAAAFAVWLRSVLAQAEPGLLAEVSRRSGIPMLEGGLVGRALPAELLGVPRSYYLERGVFPIALDGERVEVAVCNPLEVSGADWLAVGLGKPLALYLVPEADLREAVNLAYLAQTTRDGEASTSAEQGEFVGEVDLLDAGDEAPVIRTLNRLLSDALRMRASDIHIEPGEREVTVRYRVDGVLEEGSHLPRVIAVPLISRIKVLCQLDIAERRLPQDGRMKVSLADKPVDIRVSVLPTAHGERVVLRLLERGQVLLGLGEIGLLPEQLSKLDALMQRSNGLVLVTGPTGSGKTTTLYGALRSLDPGTRNVITLEDPVEYQIPGISQIPINPRIDLTFAKGLRSVLRQDPDVIMVGEIRDRETAEMALQASLTGHFVLSTLHTNDAASAVARLADMGIEPFLLSTSLLAVVAQRLVRRLCPECRRLMSPESSSNILPEGTSPPSKVWQAWEAVGCPACRNTGYQGRHGVFEVLEVTEPIRGAIMAKADASEILRRARLDGYRTMLDNGLVLAGRGVTSVQEVLRVTLSELG